MAATVRAGSAVVAAGTTSTGAVTAIPTLPTGTATGDRVFVVGTGTAALTLSANGTGWTPLLASTSLGSGSAGASTGPRTVAIWWRDKTAGWSTMPTVQSASMTANSVAACAVSVQLAAGESFDVPQVGTGSYATGSTSMSATTGTALLWRTGALALAADSFPSTTTTSSGSITATSTTFGTKTNTVTSAGTTSGNDVALAVWTAPCSSGNATAHTTTTTATLGTARTAGAAIIAQSVIVEPWISEGWESVPVGTAVSTSNTTATAASNAAGNMVGHGDPDPVLSGARSVLTDSTLNQAFYLEWTPGTVVQDFFAEVVFYLPSGTPPASMDVLLAARFGGSTLRGQLGIDMAGRLAVRNNASSSIWTSTNPVPTQTWVRAQLYALSTSSGAGSAQARMFYGANVNGTTPDVDSGAIGTWNGGDVDSVRLGMVIQPSSPFQAYLDSFTVRTDTWPSAPAVRWHDDDLADVAGAVDEIVVDFVPGGTDYAPSITPDTVDAVDAVTVGMGRFVTDAAGAIDSPPTVVRAVDRQLTDAAGVADAVAVGQGRSLADAAGITDSVAIDIGHALTASPADAAGAVDAGVTIVQAQQISAADTAGAVDAGVSASVGYPRAPADVAGAVDSVTIVQAQQTGPTDAAGVADAVAVGQGRSVTDTAGAMDSVTVEQTIVRSVTDAAGASEQVSTGRGFVLTEAAGATDTATTVQSVSRSVTDAAGASDDIVVAFTGQLRANPVDVAGAVDSVTVELDMDRTATDAAGAVDSVATAQDFARSPVDAAGAADSVAPVQDIRITVADTVGAVDEISTSEVVPVDYVIEVADTAGAVDSVTVVLARGYTVQAQDFAGAVDEIVVEFLAGRDIEIDWGRAEVRQLAPGGLTGRRLDGHANGRTLSGAASSRSLAGTLEARDLDGRIE